MKKNFLHISDLSADKIYELLEKSKWIKEKFKKNEDYRPFKGKTLAMIFAKPSARTRVSFETGFYLLGVHSLFFGPNDIGIGKRESTEDIARVLSRFCDVLAIRTFEQKELLDYAHWASIPVINALTDLEHPCQALADYLTIQENFGFLKGLTLTYVGDGNNILHYF